jgi:hypothetical protein
LSGLVTTADAQHVLHRCDNRACCNPAHLYIGTHHDNMRDRVARDRYQRGPRHYLAKLTWDDVARIRGSTLTDSTLARIFGVKHTTIHDARHGRTYVTR